MFCGRWSGYFSSFGLPTGTFGWQADVSSSETQLLPTQQSLPVPGGDDGSGDIPRSVSLHPVPLARQVSERPQKRVLPRPPPVRDIPSDTGEDDSRHFARASRRLPNVPLLPPSATADRRESAVSIYEPPLRALGQPLVGGHPKTDRDIYYD